MEENLLVQLELQPELVIESLDEHAGAIMAPKCLALLQAGERRQGLAEWIGGEMESNRFWAWLEAGRFGRA